jgi:hypothetical protein
MPAMSALRFGVALQNFTIPAYVRVDGRVLGLKARIVCDSGGYSAFPS